MKRSLIIKTVKKNESNYNYNIHFQIANEEPKL